MDECNSPFLLGRREGACQATALVFRATSLLYFSSTCCYRVQPRACSSSVRICQENVYLESWWSCWLPSRCPLPSSPLGVLSILLTREQSSEVKAPWSLLLLPGMLMASLPTLAPCRLLVLLPALARGAQASGRSVLLHPQCSCGWVLRWVWASGMCLFPVPLLHGRAKLSLLCSYQDYEILLTCIDSPHFCPGWEQVQLAVILTQPFSLSLESRFLGFLFHQDPLRKIYSSCCLCPATPLSQLSTPSCLLLDHHHPCCPKSSQCLSQYSP